MNQSNQTSATKQHVLIAERSTTKAVGPVPTGRLGYCKVHELTSPIGHTTLALVRTKKHHNNHNSIQHGAFNVGQNTSTKRKRVDLLREQVAVGLIHRGTENTEPRLWGRESFQSTLTAGWPLVLFQSETAFPNRLKKLPTPSIFVKQYKHEAQASGSTANAKFCRFETQRRREHRASQLPPTPCPLCLCVFNHSILQSVAGESNQFHAEGGTQSNLNSRCLSFIRRQRSIINTSYKEWANHRFNTHHLRSIMRSPASKL